MYAAIWITISALGLGLSFSAEAADCRDLDFEQTSFSVCWTEPARDDLRLFLNDDTGAPLGTFDKVDDTLSGSNQQLAFAMNAGMYHPDRRPVGLYVEMGQEGTPIVTRDGPGNFGLLPNGVLCLTDDSAAIHESRAFDAAGQTCRFATQSGPMLVINGKLHPRFLPNSDSRFIRNGVGVTPDGKLIAAISNQPVNFHQFARLFRDVLNTPNALYLDGKVSRLYAPNLQRHDLGFPMGPILGLVETTP